MIFSRSCFAVAYCGTQRDVCLIDEEVNFVHFSTLQSNFFTFLNRLVLSCCSVKLVLTLRTMCDPRFKERRRQWGTSATEGCLGPSAPWSEQKGPSLCIMVWWLGCRDSCALPPSESASMTTLKISTLVAKTVSCCLFNYFLVKLIKPS